ncbi:hypothetical protein ACTHSP_24010, partial [Neisseria sp. P0001.S005]|uniref:hypothetical protein n=1 Tax=Neisseria sp. P0001.S005 TaxID=3436649 RepID=UPI003F7E30C6
SGFSLNGTRGDSLKKAIPTGVAFPFPSKDFRKDFRPSEKTTYSCIKHTQLRLTKANLLFKIHNFLYISGFQP